MLRAMRTITGLREAPHDAEDELFGLFILLIGLRVTGGRVTPQDGAYAAHEGELTLVYPGIEMTGS